MTVRMGAGVNVGVGVWEREWERDPVGEAVPFSASVAEANNSTTTQAVMLAKCRPDRLRIMRGLWLSFQTFFPREGRRRDCNNAVESDVWTMHFGKAIVDTTIALIEWHD